MIRPLASLVLAASLVASLAVAGEQTASACPVQPAASQPVQHARIARVHHRGRVAPAAAPTPPVAPAPGGTSAAGAEGYNLARVNAYRATAGLAPVALDPTLTSFAKAGSQQLISDHVPHGHFRNAGDAIWHQGFTNGAAENQGSNTGWPRAAADPTQNEQKQIDQILASMMAEGPGGGHYQNMMNPKAKRIGIGLIEDGDGKLFLTNDFSQ